MPESGEPIPDVEATGRVRYLRAPTLPMVSGKISALILALCFALTGILAPVAAHLPRWIEFEMVLMAWWAIWVAALTCLLYRGRRVNDDMSIPRGEMPALEGDFSSVLPGCSGSSTVGCEETLGALVVVVLLIAAALILFEFVLPAVAFLLYILIRGMLATVVNSDTKCRRRIGLAATWAMLYSSVYTAPLALVVWGIHTLARHH